jgi:hypothetical protein
LNLPSPERLGRIVLLLLVVAALVQVLVAIFG